MDRTDQRIAIARACGTLAFSYHFLYRHFGRTVELVARTRDDAQSNWDRYEETGDVLSGQIEEKIDLDKTPDYPNDLNAMHEAEKLLDGPDLNDPNGLRYLYTSILYRLCPDEQQPCRARADQRAEALVRTLNFRRDDR